MTKNDNIITVYYAAERYDENDWNILYPTPRTLLHTMQERKDPDVPPQNFFRCPAVTELTSHTYVIPVPMNTGCKWVGTPEGEELQFYGFDWKEVHRPAIRDNKIALFVHGLLLFADQPLEMLYTPAYFSQTSYSHLGAIVPAKFDIGQWYRPVHFEFNLWDGVREMHLKEGEPLAYVTFLTDKKIVMKRFMDTPQLHAMSTTMAHAGTWESRVKLAKRYRRFRESQMRERILKEIQRTAID
jgi:hypothetical protein